MSPFLESLGQALGLLGGLVGLGVMVWGAGRKQRGREAVDEQAAAKIATVKAAANTHATKCDEVHEQTRDDVVKLRERVVVLETIEEGRTK